MIPVQQHKYMKKAAGPTKAEIHWEELVNETRREIDLVGNQKTILQPRKNAYQTPTSHK